MAKKKKKTDKMIKLKDLVHTIKVDNKKAEKVDAKIGAENDLAIEKDKKGRDVFAVGLTEARPMASGPMVAGIEFQPGDMWSNDFDYVGMLKYSVAMEIPEDPNALLGVIDTLKALSNSYEDVNYHSENQDLGNAIEYIEDAKGVEDLERAQDFLEMHKRKAAKTLKDITRR
tara:strand:- start:141 stop:656 length:516 start_codon:yes stop_codon:yes gene_type:complete